MSKKYNTLKDVSKSTRASAIDLLIHCENGAFANDIVPARLDRSTFSQLDRSLITKVVYSTLRNQIKIDWALNRISSKPVLEMDVIARNALRSVVAQCVDGFDMYGVVNETIKVLPFSMKSFVNAISRKVADLHRQDKLFVNIPDEVNSSLPDFILHEIKDAYPSDIDDVIVALNSPAVITFASLDKQNKAIQGTKAGSLIFDAIIAKKIGDVSQLEEFKDGKIIVVDQASQLVVKVVDAQKDDIVLDVCSAPGGKSVLISRSAKHVFSCDQSYSRLTKFAQTINRNCLENIDLIVSDARNLPFDTKFDRVLIDAPCSGLGVLRRRPDARHRITQKDITELSKLQREIVKSAAEQVKPGGYLIYSVCTFTREETLEIDKYIAKVLPEFKAESINIDLVDTSYLQPRGRGFQLRATSEFDGMYILKLKFTL